MPGDFDFEDRLNTMEDVMRRLANMLAGQHAINEEQKAINARLTAVIERLDVTQARIETLLAKMIPTGENGREA